MHTQFMAVYVDFTMPTFSPGWLYFETVTPIEFTKDYTQATPMLFRPLELHLYFVIMGCTGVCISFLSFNKNMD